MSAILLDPEFGLPAWKKRNGKGLLLAYEKTGYDSTIPGHLPDLLDLWSVRRLKEAGADCIKILLYYTPFEKSAINDHKHAWVERIGDECRRMTFRSSWNLWVTTCTARTRRVWLCEAQAGYRYRVDGGVWQGALRRGRAEGRGSGADGVCVGHEGLQGRAGLHAGGGSGALPRGGFFDAQAFYLFVCGREQSGVH